MSIPSRRKTIIAILFFASQISSTPAVAAEDGLQLSFLGAGKAQLSFRYRYEAVEQDGLAKTAHASTLRTRLTYATSQAHSVQLVLEADNVLRLGGALYSDGNRTMPGYPVVADPQGTEINQALLKLVPAAGTSVSVGRQRINFDDQRFVGGVGWRQNEQTYDAVTAVQKFSDNAKLEYGYLWNVNRIFGPDGGAQDSDWSCQCHILNFKSRLPNDTKLALFIYELDIEDAPSQANRTLGFRLTGDHELTGKREIDYLLSYASQTDTGANAVDYRASYFHARLALTIAAVKGKIGMESLQGDQSAPGSQFVTPFATLHAFNGWADKFLGIPDAGLRDLYVGIDKPFAGALATLTWHRFSAEDGGADYGSEWDLSVSKKLKNGLSILGKLADYRSDGFASDTTKIWLMLFYAP